MKAPAPASLSARTPIQQRAQTRCDAVLAAAHQLLAEQGLAGFSIPTLAQRLGFPRATIYNFFPTPEAILKELVLRGLKELELQLRGQFLRKPTRDWRKQIRGSVAVVAEFYAERPVERLLILGTAISDDTHRAVALVCRHLGDTARHFFEAGGLSLPSEPVDVLPLAVDLATTCLRHSVLACGKITPAYQEAAVQAMVGMLEPYVQTASDLQSERVPTP